MNICRNCNCIGCVIQVERWINNEKVKILKCFNCKHEAEVILKTKKINKKESLQE